MFFEKPSLRTRLTFEAGMDSLGGSTFFVDQTGGRLDARESSTTSPTTSSAGSTSSCCAPSPCDRRRDGHVRARSGDQRAQRTRASLPGARRLFRSCRNISAISRSFTFAYVGDGNNMAHSLLLSGRAAGCEGPIATPKATG